MERSSDEMERGNEQNMGQQVEAQAEPMEEDDLNPHGDKLQHAVDEASEGGQRQGGGQQQQMR